MSIQFFTKNLNTRLYRRAHSRMIHEMFPATMDYIFYLRHWDWKIYPSTDAPNDPHFDGQEGVGGVTGMGLVKVYLEDKRTNMIHDIFRRVFRQNIIVISHELSHSALIHIKKTHKVKLRHDDWSGHKAGTILNFSVAEVHDRHVEGRFKFLRPFRFFDMRTMTYIRVSRIQVIDIDDLL